MNTSATLFISASHKFNGNSNKPPKERRLFPTQEGKAQTHACNPKNTEKMYLDKIKPKRKGVDAVDLLCPATR